MFCSPKLPKTLDSLLPTTALGVTLDYLVKDAEYENIDQDALTRLKLIEKLPLDERSHLFATMDAFFAKHKLQSLLK
jgi:hypothetical protein